MRIRSFRLPLLLSFLLATSSTAVAWQRPPVTRRPERRGAQPPTTVGWASITAGGMHTCGVRTDGSAYCWGYNGWGQLGDGTRRDRYIPVPVAGVHRFRMLSAGDEHTCGVRTNGSVLCWGRSGGIGTFEHHRSRPGTVPGGLTFRSVAAGTGYSCGLSTTGRAYCWYWSEGGQPQVADSVRRFDSLSAGGYATCGVMSAGETFCWKGDSLATLPGLSAIAQGSGSSHACGLTREGVAYCWGANGDGQLGDGSRTRRERPVAVAGELRWRSLSAGYASTCGITLDSLAYCWGDGAWGQLGSGSRAGSSVPEPVEGSVRFRALAVGDHHACAITTDGAAWCWGRNASGELGDGSTLQRDAPVRVAEPAAPGATEIPGAPPPPPLPPGQVILPPRYDSSRAYPVVVFLPYTGGSAAGLFSAYVSEATGREREQRGFEVLMGRLFPGGADRGREFAAILVSGVGSEDDYYDGDAWWETILRYEQQVLTDLAAFASAHRLDTARVALAGYSLGGDLSWAIALRNPTRIRGAIVMGSRASYRARAPDHRALAERGARFFFAMGDAEEEVRLAGARAAVQLLGDLGVTNRYRGIPRAGHVWAPLPMFAEALDFVLWGR